MRQRRPGLAALVECYLDERIGLGSLTVQQFFFKFGVLVGSPEIEGYVGFIKRLGYAKTPSVLHITPSKIIVFLRSVKEKRGAVIASRSFATLYAFCSWLAENGYINGDNPMRNMKRDRVIGGSK